MIRRAWWSSFEELNVDKDIASSMGAIDEDDGRESSSFVFTLWINKNIY
jgi:hypothetical protein